LSYSLLIGTSTPVYDIAKHYQPSDIRDLLIRNTALGESLASCFSSKAPTSEDQPEHSVVLMRGHGYTVAGSSIEECVFRAIYTKENAVIQTTSLLLRTAYPGGGDAAPSLQYLHDDEITGTTGISVSGWGRAWDLWTREVEAAPLYVNHG
jgi:ribulose-5-phosphate 4-epimerase/fuculose-1-phosphate aldolase